MRGGAGVKRFTALLTTPETPPGASTVKNYYLGGFAAAARLSRGLGWTMAVLILLRVIHEAISSF